MKIYQVGPDTSYDVPGEETEEYEWLVFWYKDEGYDGHGETVAYCKGDGLLYVKDLSHCSCYSPFDWGMESGVKMTVEAFLKEKDDIHDYDARNEIKDKVRELLASPGTVTGFSMQS